MKNFEKYLKNLKIYENIRKYKKVKRIKREKNCWKIIQKLAKIEKN